MVVTIITLFLFIIYVIYYFSFTLPREEKIAFRLFELRDKVAMEVIKGNLSDESFEYVFMVTLINTQIKFIDKEIPYTKMFTSALKVTDEQVDMGVDLIYGNPYLKEIYTEAIEIFKKSFRFKKYVMKYMYVVPVTKLVDLALKILTIRRWTDAKTKKTEKRELCQYRENAAQNFGLMEKVIGISHNTY